MQERKNVTPDPGLAERMDAEGPTHSTEVYSQATSRQKAAENHQAILGNPNRNALRVGKGILTAIGTANREDVVRHNQAEGTQQVGFNGGQASPKR